MTLLSIKFITGAPRIDLCCVQEEDIMAERAHLTVAPPRKKDNNNYKKFKPQRRNNQSNTRDLFSSSNAPKGSKK